MHKIIPICIAIVLSGCANMTPKQKTVAWVVGGVVVASIVLSSSENGGSKGCKQTVGGSGADFEFYCRPIE